MIAIVQGCAGKTLRRTSERHEWEALMSLLLVELDRLTEFLLFIASRAAILATVLARDIPFLRFVFQARHDAGPIGGR